MPVQQVIDLNPSRVITAPTTWSVDTISRALSDGNVGTVMLTNDNGNLAGIVSERDIVKALVKHGESVGDLPVTEIMVKDVITCAPETRLEDVLASMSRHSIRHMPVLRNGTIVGMVSARDILDFQRTRLIEDAEKRVRNEEKLRRAYEAMEKEVEDRTLDLKNEIARRKQIEIALRNSESRFRAFFDHSPSIMYLKNRNHELELVNAKYLEFHNTTEAAVIGKRGGSTLDMDRRAKIEEFDRKVMESGQPTHNTMPQVSGNGEQRTFIVSKFPITDSVGGVIGIGGINTDMTELRDREEKLVLAKAEAERAARISKQAASDARAANRSKSEFLANMSHELRTPMNGVLGMATVLSRTELTPAQREGVDTIRESGEALLELLNDILDLSKIEAGCIEPEAVDFSLSNLLSSVERLWRSRATDKGLEFLIRNRVSDIDLFRSDSSRIRQILANLLNNAIKFTDKGAIELEVRAIDLEDDEFELRFEIRDTGVGISAKEIGKLFRPFSQADSSTTRRYGGSGLGLFISKQLAELLGGDIGVESTPDVGTAFWFSIVAKRGHLAAVGEIHRDDTARPEVAHGANGLLRVLVAEDNHINQRVISCLLETLGCQIDLVENGLEAVAAASENTYDLILMDVQMPEMDGLAATQKIRSMESPIASVPIIAVTANAMRGDREQYLAAGMTDYLPKPIDQPALMNAIANNIDLELPQLDSEAFAQTDEAEIKNEPPSESAIAELTDIMDDLDSVIDGTGK